jgi:transglutaminase-like putative cysteine protease
MEFNAEIVETNPEISKYLKSGEQTQITPEMSEVAKGVTGNAVEKSKTIIGMMSARLRNEDFNPDIFRKRTAEQIIKDGFVTGCTDSAVVFVAAARTCGLSAKYVETVDEEWLKSDSPDIVGHQFAQVYDEERKGWFWVDPTLKKVDTVSPREEGKVIYKEGLDSWDVGFIDGKSMETALYAFRESWKKQQSI